jgi:predicted nucleic acid-binding protein
MLVVDTSALVDVLTTDPAETPDLARRVRDAEWMSAPDLLDYEVLNVLRKMAQRGDIDEQLAEESRRSVRSLRLSRHPLTDEMADRVWQLRHIISAYDAAYVALAERLDVPLVTTDRRLANAAQRLTSVSIECYVSS